MKKLMKGNKAIAEAAIQAGCRAFFGYPITPQNDIPEYLSWRLPELGGAFVQAESEVAAINMVYGVGATGTRVMTSSSGPGVALMQETLSYAACASVPMVVVNVARGGPGLGSLESTQGDYFQTTRGGGHGDYYNFTLAPYSVQEACDFVQLAFEKAEKYRCPVFVLADAMIGQMMETVEIKTVPPKPYDTSWAARGWKDKSRPQAVIASIHTPQKLARVVQGLLDTYERMAREDVMYETVDLEGAEYVFVAFGTMARLCLSAMEKLRDKGIRAGLIRPQTLFPFPEKIIAQTAGLEGVKGVVVPELNAGQMVYDVKLAVNGVKPVYSHKNLGSIMPSPAQLCEYVASLKEKR